MEDPDNDTDIGATADERPRSDRRPKPARTPESPAETAATRYVIGDEIARGGMGVVALGTDRVLGRTVAIKQMLDHDELARRRFAREMRITARLEHPSIIPLYDAGTDAEGRPYYVMRKVDGRPLEHLVRERKTLDDRLGLVPNVLAAVEAIAHAHGRGVLHRDIKPTNILVGQLGETVVIDWGLAKVIDDPDDRDEIADIHVPDPNAALETRAGVAMGTPGFMAPEQLDGNPGSKRTDVYALGATLYFALAAKLPHEATTADEMMVLAAAGPPRPIRDIVPGVPDDLVTIVDRALGRSAAERYADAGELADDLRRFMTGRMVSSHRYSRGARVMRFVRRHRVPVAVSAIALVVTAGFGIAAVRGIVAARDVAITERAAAEAAREREADRADEASIARARTLAATQPIAAVAIVQRLASTTRWRAARDVVAHARTQGVPWALPAPHQTTALAMTRDGRVAYAAGADGSIRRYDLDARTTTTIRANGDAVAIALAGDALVIGEPARISLSIAGTTSAWIDAAKHAWVQVTGSPPVALAFGKPMHVDVSPDGSRVAVSGIAGTDVFAVADLATPMFQHAGVSLAAAWRDDGARLGIAGEPGGWEIDLSTAPPTERLVGKTTFHAAVYIGDVLHLADTNGEPYRANSDREIAHAVNFVITHAAAMPGGGAFANSTGDVVVFDGGGEATVKLPSAPLAIAAGGTRVLVALADHLVLYDVTPILPRHIALPPARNVMRAFVDDRRYLSAADDTWTIYDLETGATTSFGNLGRAQTMSLGPAGAYAIARTTTDAGATSAIGRIDHPPVTVDGSALAAGPDALVVVRDRALVRYTLSSGATTPIATIDEPIVAVVPSPVYIAVATASSLLRIAIATGAIERAALPGAKVVRLSERGVIVAATGKTLRRWDGRQLVDLATFDSTIFDLVVDGDAVIVEDEHHAYWRVHAGEPTARAVPAWAVGATPPSRARLSLIADAQGRIHVFDLETQDRWPLEHAARDVHFDLSPSGKRAITADDAMLTVHDLDLPDDPAAYASWVRGATNLSVGRTEEIVWPGP